MWNVSVKLALGLILLAGIWGCAKAKIDIETQSSEDWVNSINAYGDLAIQVIAQGNAVGYLNNRTGWTELSCATSTLTGDTFSYPSESLDLTSDFTAAGCTGAEGSTRKGKWTAQFFQNYWSNVGGMCSVSLDSYEVNGQWLTGTMTMTHLGNNVYRVEIANGQSRIAGNSTQVSGTVEIEWSQGAATDSVASDDVFLISGTLDGVNANARTYSAEIDGDLTKRTSCQWIEKGLVEVVPDGLAVRQVDFGNGNCKQSVTITLNGSDYQFVAN